VKRSADNRSTSKLDELIADPIVQLTMRADGVAESEFHDLLRAAVWTIANQSGRGADGEPSL